MTITQQTVDSHPELWDGENGQRCITDNRHPQDVRNCDLVRGHVDEWHYYEADHDEDFRPTLIYRWRSRSQNPESEKR